jgi:hypothetical protein
MASVVAVLSAGSLSARDSSLQLDSSYCRSHRDKPPPFSFGLRHASLADFLCGPILQCSSLGQARSHFFIRPQSLRCPWRSSFSTAHGLSCLAASPVLNLVTVWCGCNLVGFLAWIVAGACSGIDLVSSVQRTRVFVI